MKIEGRLFRKYVRAFMVVVGGMLVFGGLIDVYFSYTENKAALVRLQREKAALARVRIEQFLRLASCGTSCVVSFIAFCSALHRMPCLDIPASFVLNPRLGSYPSSWGRGTEHTGIFR